MSFITGDSSDSCFQDTGRDKKGETMSAEAHVWACALSVGRGKNKQTKQKIACWSDSIM